MSASILVTSRLILREWEERDRDAFAELNADPEVMEFLAKILTREESDAYIETVRAHFAKHGYGLWAVEYRGDGALVGMIGLRVVPFEPPFAVEHPPLVEVAWRICRPFWGQGMAPEAARAALRYGFEVAGLREIVAFTLPVNLRSQRVMEKIGMTRDLGGDFDHPLLPEGHPKRRQVLYRISAPGFAGE